MSKKVKVLVLVLVTVVVLTVGGVATVMAQEEPTPTPEAEAKGLLARVADILEIDTEALIDAFKQAQQEMREDAFISRLYQAVEEGSITQEQAEEIIEWWELRPDDEIRNWWGLKPEVIKPGMVEHALCFRSSLRTHQQNGLGWGFCPRLPRLAD